MKVMTMYSRFVIFCIMFLGYLNTVDAQQTPDKVVKDFGEAMSSWCSTNNILYREKIDALCSGPKSCRVEDKIHADYQKKRGLTNYETFVLDSYMNMFQTLRAQNIQFQMSNVKLGATDMMPDGELSFVTADIKVSGPVNYTVTDLFLVREGKITGIYSHSSQLGFSHLNGSLIRALKIGRYTFDPLYEGNNCGFRNGYAKVCNETGRAGLIDVHGNVIIPCIWDEIFYYGGEFATGSDESGHNMKTYDLRFNGKIVPDINYFADGAGSNCFVNGYMRVASKNGLYGYLRENDPEYNVEFKYTGITDFNDGFAIVYQNDKQYIIDSNFTELFESNENYEICGSFHEGLASVRNKKTDKYGFIDLKGNLVIPCIYEEADDFSEGLCAVYSVKENCTLLGFIDNKGNNIIPIMYEGCEIKRKYVRWPRYFKDGYIDVRKYINNKEYGTLIGKDGKPLPGFTWDYERVYRFSENKAIFRNNGKYGFFNRNGKVVVPAKYDFVTDFHNGYASVQMNVDGTSKWGCINHDGVEVIPCMYENEIIFENGIALVSLDGEIGLIDVYGNSSFF